MRTICSLLFVAVLATASLDAPAYAWPGKLLLAQVVGISQDEAAAKVRAETGGRVLGVQTENQDGVSVYLVKVLLPDGRVRVVAVSGR